MTKKFKFTVDKKGKEDKQANLSREGSLIQGSGNMSAGRIKGWKAWRMETRKRQGKDRVKVGQYTYR